MIDDLCKQLLHTNAFENFCAVLVHVLIKFKIILIYLKAFSNPVSLEICQKTKTKFNSIEKILFYLQKKKIIIKFGTE